MKRIVFVSTIGLALMMVWAVLAALGTGTAVASPTAPHAIPYPDQRNALTASARWLVANHQNDDGGYTSFSSGANAAASDVSGTTDAIIAIASAGYNPAAPLFGKSNTPIGYLSGHSSDVSAYAATDGSQAGKLILGLVAANQNPRNFGNYNLVISLTQQISPTGQYHVNTAYKQSLAILALASVHETIPVSATQWLKAQQAIGGATDGSWDDGFGTTGNADATALSVMALAASGEPPTSTVMIRARDFLSRTQTASGGWEYGAGFGENANSTGLVVQALSALGENFYGTGTDWERGGTTPMQALLLWQNITGAFQADFGSGRFDSFYSTVQALPAATGKAYPLPGRYEAAYQGAACLETLQDAATGGFESFAGSGVDAGGTAKAIEAIHAVGDDPQAARWTTGGVTNVVTALKNLTPVYLSNGRGGRIGKVMQGVVAAGLPYTVTNFAGYNLPISMTGYLSPTGEYANTGFGPFAHDEAMKGLIDAGFPVADTAVAWLINAQTNGNWGSPDSNGLSLNVLGALDQSIPGSLPVLHQSQLASGGWNAWGTTASINSTSEVVQGLISYEENPFAPSWSVIVSGTVTTPADVVMAQQLASGCWPAYGGGNGPASTTDAMLMLTLQPKWWTKDVYLPIVQK